MVRDLPTSPNASRPATVLEEEAAPVGVRGFFRVGRSTAGRWWLMPPDGTPMFYRGVCALWMPDNYQGLEAVEFRRHWERENGCDSDTFVKHKFCWNPVALDRPSYGLIDSSGREGQFTSPLLREVDARLERIALGEIAPVTTRSVP